MASDPMNPPISLLHRVGLGWLQEDFGKLWMGQTVSLVGSEVTRLAVPLTAVLYLNASPREMGWLSAVEQLPFFLFSLFIGVWVDRVRRVPLLLLSDGARVVLLTLIPLLVFWNALRMEWLYGVAFAVGVFGIIFDVAHYAFVPQLVGREGILSSNSKLQVSYSAAEAAGPGLAGVLIQLITAPSALLLDAATFAISAWCIHSIHSVETPTPPTEQRIGGITDGVRFLMHHPLMRVIMIASIIMGFFQQAIVGIYILYASETLHLSPAVVGAIFAVSGIAAIGGAMLAQRVAQRWGAGIAIVGGWWLSTLAYLLIPVASLAFPIVLLVAGQMLTGGAGTIANIHQWSLRQTITPDHLQGRVTAAHRFMVYGSATLGAVAGGFLAEAIGIESALWICAAGVLLGPLYATFSPLRHLVTHPRKQSLALCVGGS